MAVASPNEDTCNDVTNIDTDCGQNIKVRNKLTSGYHHGRGNTKPTKTQGAPTGKCSHGGPDDESRKMVAKCGINKETPTESLSPHFYLHEQAYLAAIAATTDFLTMNDTGILKMLGSKTFRRNIQHQNKRGCITSVCYRFLRFHEGRNCCLAGGYDCPEFASDGIARAISISRNGSTIFVFTDADAKDANRQQELTDAAITKRIIISPFITGTCARGRRAIQYVKRKDTASFFRRLAKATGGKVYRTTKEEISAVLNDVIEKTFPVGGVIVDAFNWSRTSSNKVMFAVDSSITVLKIAVCCPGADSGVDLFYPNGTRETFASRISRKLFTTRHEVIMSLQRPTPGRYSLQRKSSSNWSGSVNITAQSLVKQETEILENTGALPTLKGSPIAGTNYTFYVNIYNLGENGTCNDLILTDMLGNELFNVHTIQTTNFMTVRCAAIFITPNQFFQLKLNGTDNNGLEFTRKNALVFKPTNVKFRIVSPEIENTGTINETYEVAITDDDSAAVLPKRRQHTVFAGDIRNGSFTLKPTSSSVILKFSITVYMGKTSEMTQRISKTVLMTDIERPVCTIVSLNGTCNRSSLNTAQCHKYHWFADADISFKGTELENITSSAGSATELLIDDISGLRYGPVNISIRGGCCTPSVIVAAVDTDGYIALCRIELSGGEIVTSMESYDIDVSIKTKTKRMLVIQESS
ncbi:unnamed protein product [Mytilus edulis]|uniref:Uncharacterized protein n=1 Tax=Mytilus edulis TaxID=6550 RepID=A0A8S3U5J2_MYTED|nr:unnamed protein product [Mytilus edulis]